MTVRVIDRLRYDDTTATEIAAFNSGQPGTRGRRSETLFKTPGGRYFLRVRRPRRNYAPGQGPQRFLAVERDSAITWLQGNNFPTQLNAEFPVVDA